MRARNLGEALKLIMDERGWSQTRLGRELGRSQDWVSDIIRGKRDTYLKKAASLLAKVEWELHITPKSDKGCVEDDPVKRREFVAGVTSAFFVPSPKTTPFHDPSFVEELTRRSVSASHQVGGNSVAGTLVRHAEKIRSASAGGGRAFQSAASEFMRQGSWILWQTDRSDLAIRFANDALHLATQAEHPDKQALAYAALSGVSLDLRNSAERAVELAHRGLRIPGIDDEPRAFLSGFMARALANVSGHERQTRRQVDHALNIDTLSAIDRADILGISGRAIRDTGDRREALKRLAEAADYCASYSPYLSAMYLSDQIMIVLDMRDPSRAASLMNALSHAVPLIDSARLDSRVGEILQATKPWSGVREMREARGRLQSVRPSNEGQQ